MQLRTALARLRARQPELRQAGVRSLYVFGSTARDQAREDSDIDLFFDYDKGRFGLFELIRVKGLASQILGAPADIMTRDSLHPLIRDRAQAEAQRVF